MPLLEQVLHGNWRSHRTLRLLQNTHDKKGFSRRRSRGTFVVAASGWRGTAICSGESVGGRLDAIVF